MEFTSLNNISSQHIDGARDARLDYWRQQLKGVPPLLALPTDYPRPAQSSHQGASVSFTLSTALATQLRQVSQSVGGTLFTTLLAAFKILLYRYTRQSDIVVGSPLLGRKQAGLGDWVITNTNLLPLRTEFADHLTVRQLLQQVQTVFLEASAHDLPVETLIEQLGCEQHASYAPLCQVRFVLHHPPHSVSRLTYLSQQAEALGFASSPFDLTLALWEDAADGWLGFFKYSTDLFNATMIERMAGHWQTLLTAMVANPDALIDDLPMLTAAERHRLLMEWHVSPTDYPAAQCLHQQFEAQVERTPDAVAVVCGDQPLTYRALNQRANQLAHYLRSLGVAADVLVGLCIERSLEMLVGMLGVLKAGGAYVPLDPAYPKERLAYMVEDAQPLVLLTQAGLKTHLPAAATVVALDEDWQTIAGCSQENLAEVCQPHHLAYVIYTSGSTGKPKGVMIEHRALSNFTHGAIATYQLSPQDRVLQFASISFDAAAEEIYPCLLSGGRLVLRNQEMLGSAATFLEACSDWGITVLDLPTAYWHQLTEDLTQTPQPLPRSLRLIIIGGEAVHLAQVKRWQRQFGPTPQIINSYGPTETTVVATVHSITETDAETAAAIPIGRALPNVRTYLLDANQQPVPLGVPGELYIGGASVARGYLNRPELTAERFIPNPFGAEPGNRLYRSGDLVRYRADGNLEFLGRIDHQVKIRGFRIELGEIEKALGQHPDVNQAMVTVWEDDAGDRRLGAYVVVAEAAAPTSSELRQYLQQILPDYMIPAVFIPLNAFPLTPNGKVDRRALPEPAAAHYQSSPAYVAPRTHQEQQLAELWVEVLRLDQVGIHDNFFEIGGHSLLVAKLFERIERGFECRLPLATIFQAPTIAKLARQLETTRQAAGSVQLLQAPWLVPFKAGAVQPPLFLIIAFDEDAELYLNLARYFQDDRPIYGLRACDPENRPLLFTRIADKADYFIRQMKQIQPEGPYLLGGQCGGGMVAFEMAQRLQRQGETVALVALIEAVDSQARKIGIRGHKLLKNMWLLYQQFKLQGLMKPLFDYIDRQLPLSTVLLNGLPLTWSLQYHQDRQLPLPAQIYDIDAFDLFNFAVSQHRSEGVFKGNFVLLRATEDTGEPNDQPFIQIYRDPLLGWGQRVRGNIRIHDVPGGHGTMLAQPHAQTAAEMLQAAVQAAL
jgi:aspartate racemase